MITAYLYRSCSSCRKAEELLKENGAEYKVREYFKQRFDRNELQQILGNAGLSVEDVLSTRSTPYRDLGLASKSLSDDEILDLMVTEPRLLKRPLLVSARKSVVGYNENEIKALIAADRIS